MGGVAELLPRTSADELGEDVEKRERGGAQFEQAKKPTQGSRFLQIVAKPDRPNPSKSRHKLNRVAFRVSRLMEFCSERELVNQTGHGTYDWLLMVLKELMDNALDACEEAEVAPVIEVEVTIDPRGPITISVRDNASGFEADTIESILDYTIRVSSHEAYVSPTTEPQGRSHNHLVA